MHLTTRRSFIGAMGFGGVSLYGLWAKLGMAPSPLNLWDPHAGAPEPTGGHGGHAAADGPTLDEFRRLAGEFVERNRTPDGAVHPRRAEVSPTQSSHHQSRPAHSVGHDATPSYPSYDHGPPAIAAPYGHSLHSDPTEAPPLDPHDPHTVTSNTQDPLDVYLLAEKWFYEPAHLRLDAGVPYRFRMMATDVSHGASIQLGSGSRLLRLRPARMVEVQQTFTRPGSYLVYCTIYCGDAHDLMQGRIEVV